MELTHCPEGKKLFDNMQESARKVTADFDVSEEQIKARNTAMAEWELYRAHRQTCEICGMKK